MMSRVIPTKINPIQISRLACSLSKIKLIFYVSSVLLFQLNLFAEEKKAKKDFLVFGAVESKFHKNISIAMYDEINKRAKNFNIRLKFFPTKRAFFELKEGHTDGEAARVVGLTKTMKGLDNIIQLSTPLLTAGLILYSKKKLPNNIDLKKKNPFKIAYDRGYLMAYGQIHKDSRIPLDNDKQALEMLKLERTEGALFLKFNNYSTIPQPIEKNKKYHKLEIYKTDLAPLINNKHKKHIPEFEAILKKMKKEKVIEDLLKRLITESITKENKAFKQK